MRILVTGANGTVGSYAAEVFDGHKLTLTDRDTWDVTQRVPLRASPVQACDAILHLAAATDVDACELDPDLAYKTNAIGTQNVAEVARWINVPLVYVSTAGVFGGDGAPGPFTEFDPPHPANVYGRSKLAGETLAAEQTRDLYIVRAGWMFGGDPMTDPKFVGKIARQLADGTPEIRAVDDKVGTPTYARDLLVGIRDLLEAQAPFGVYHMANEGTTSRFGMAVALSAAYGHATTTTVPVSSDEFPLPAPRADSEAIVSYKARLLGLPTPRHWTDALVAHLGTAVRAAA